ncbi:thermonuclease family protein [Microcoleus sp. bin38.metabat.b11b12b14.051]|uniref:thermonuclease family protein n=1 Tax=Microcoleus sp. bin38.metabat.b11b12b14.051 TaxID=2742709 RepID=UPI0025DC5FEE|nr:thermonuclease family protein [Microcoleus sp. bin38.metabat.b11b12b14.051]
MLIPGNGYNCLSKFVFDGDTLNLDFQGQLFKARLQWIDSPESRKNGQNNNNPQILEHWEWAEKAKTALMDLVAGKPIITIPIVKDPFDRWVCDCYIEKVSATTNLQIKLCKLGMAVSYLPFNRYSYSSRELAVLRGIITETANANRKKIGIWSKPDFILPYEFKKLTIH